MSQTRSAVSQSKQDTPQHEESDVMGVTQDSERFVRASGLMDCETCSNTAIHPSEIKAVRPRDKAVMVCSECMPEPPEEWL